MGSIVLLVCTVYPAAQVELTLDKLFNNKCELDERKYFKVLRDDIDDTELKEYKKDILYLGGEIERQKAINTRANINENLSEFDDTNEYIVSTIKKDLNYKNFDDLFEKVYRKRLELKPHNVFISGGIDSTTLYNLLKRKDIAFKPWCIRYKSQDIVFNDYEIKNVADDVVIIDFDILKFFDSGDFLETAQKYHCVTPQFLPLLKVFESIDGPIIETSSAPNGSINDIVSVDRLSTKYLSYRYALDLRNDDSIFNFYRSHHFIDQLSTDAYKDLNKKYGRDVSRGAGVDAWDQEYNIKIHLYKNIFNTVGHKAVKFTGFEALKTWYADKYIGNDPYLQVFDKHFRQPLLKRNIDKFKDLLIINILKG